MSGRLLLALGIAGTACGGEVRSTLDPQAKVTSLSSEQAALICDWLANLYGGYGGQVACDGGMANASGPTDRATCVTQWAGFEKKFSTCPATVGQLQTCFEWKVSHACDLVPPTTQPDACSVTSSAACSSG